MKRGAVDDDFWLCYCLERKTPYDPILLSESSCACHFYGGSVLALFPRFWLIDGTDQFVGHSPGEFRDSSCLPMDFGRIRLQPLWHDPLHLEPGQSRFLGGSISKAGIPAFSFYELLPFYPISVSVLS